MVVAAALIGRMAAAMAHRGHGDGGTYVAAAFDRAKRRSAAR
jgi:hypothetical protein